jgi:transposase InsO family protein
VAANFLLFLSMNLVVLHGCTPYLIKVMFFLAFIKFKLLVENLFDTKIKYFQTDNGGEYTSTTFKQYLSNNGIFHCLTCPHTSQHSGITERKHRHIVETGITLLAQSSLSAKYWVNSFLTSIFFINRLPTPILQNQSPFFTLFKKEPDYTLLRSFGCLCFPLLRPYASHKLAFRSKPYIFLGYVANQHGTVASNLNLKKSTFPVM